MSQAFINVVIPFNDDNTARVNDVLKTYTDSSEGNQPESSIKRRLNECGVIHFMTITVAPPICPSEERSRVLAERPELRNAPAHLIMEVSADVAPEEVLEKLASKFEKELNDVLRQAVGDVPRSLYEYLKEHSVVIKAPFAVSSLFQRWPLFKKWIKPKTALGQIHGGSPGMTVKRILAEQDLAERIGNLIENARSDRGWENSSPRQRLDFVRDFLWVNDRNKWAFIPEPAPLLGGSPNPERSFTNPQFNKVVGSVVSTFLKPVLYGLLAILLVVFAITWMFEPYKIAFLWTTWLAFFLLTVLVATLIGGFFRLRYLEKHDPVEDRTPFEERVQEIMKLENFCAQNHLASISRLKRGFLRRLTLRLAFIIVGTGRYVCAPGFLGKNGVIHFARWMRLPKTDQLLFWSNYGGTWDSYVGDFIADAPSGVTGIWSNCVGFPRTSGLLSEGATNRDQLVHWARRQQHPTVFWYSAYPNLTAARIRTNAAIRQGLASADSDADARDWLSLFGSAPRPAGALEISEIPTLVFGGLSSLRYSACHMIELDRDEKKCRQWLASAAAYATYGERDPGERLAVVVALAASGLGKLGLPREALETFPVAFQQGMWADWRARALGDTGENAPEHWTWGVPSDALPEGAEAKPADVLLLLYGLEQDDLSKVQTRLLAEARDLGHRYVSLELTTLAMKPRVRESIAATPQAQPRDGAVAASQVGLQGVSDTQQSSSGATGAEPPGGAGDARWTLPHEAFGFADGVSQPIIRGSPRANTRWSKHHMIEAGEIVLGYPDNLGRIPPSPTIAAEHDPGHFLPDTGPDPFRKRPEFSCYEGTGQRDLGANGTFFVVRQLQQDVTAFNDWLEDILRRFDPPNRGMTLAIGHRSMRMRAGARPRASVGRDAERGMKSEIDLSDDDNRERVREFIAAKAMGRWRDGTSLVRYPVRPGTQNTPPRTPDNDFLLGDEDPMGLNCPFGAHVRRANPREARFPGSKEEIATVNRHRILRVGRSYKISDEEQGLLFMCLNADIDRQFEFVQKTWLLNPTMHGLENEVDPILGTGPRKLTVPTQTGPIELRINHDFVRVIGGGYFFLPGRSVLRYLATNGGLGTGESVQAGKAQSESRQAASVT